MSETYAVRAPVALGLLSEQPSDDGAEELAEVSGLLAKQGRAEESVAPACA